MPSVDLVTSVPDLHTARILASAGVSYISFAQTITNLNEIVAWIEGPEVFVQMTDPDLPIPQVNGLIIPEIWYDQFSFMNKKIFWMTDRIDIHIPLDAIYTDRHMIPFPKHEFFKTFYHYTILHNPDASGNLSWIDFDEDLNLFERLFLD